MLVQVQRWYGIFVYLGPKKVIFGQKISSGHRINRLILPHICHIKEPFHTLLEVWAVRGYYTCFVLRDLCLDSPLTQWYVAPYPLLRENFPFQFGNFLRRQRFLKRDRLEMHNRLGTRYWEPGQIYCTWPPTL